MGQSFLRAHEVVSNSRVWDISGLRKKSVAPGPGGLDDHLKNPGSTDLFGQASGSRDMTTRLS